MRLKGQTRAKGKHISTLKGLQKAYAFQNELYGYLRVHPDNYRIVSRPHLQALLTICKMKLVCGVWIRGYVESGNETMRSQGTRLCGVWERDYVESGSKTMWSLGTRSLDSSWSSVQHDLLHICTHKPSRSQETERARVIKLRELGLHLHAHLQYTLITMRKNGNLLHKGLQGLRELSKRPED